MLFNNQNWSLGLVYDNPAIPEYLKLKLNSMPDRPLTVHELTAWLIIHKVRGIAYCIGGTKQRIYSLRFRWQFNCQMQQGGMDISLLEFAKEVDRYAEKT